MYKTKGIDFEKYRYPVKHDNPVTFWFKNDKSGYVFIKLDNSGTESSSGKNLKLNGKLSMAVAGIAESMGFNLYKDPEFEKKFKILNPYYKFFTNGKINFQIHHYRNGLEIDFWATDKRYCLTTRQKWLNNLPYIEKQRIKLLYKKIKEKWEKAGALCIDGVHEVNSPYAYDFVAHHKYSCWHWRKEHATDDIFSQQYTDGDEPSKWNSKGKDGEKLLRNGQIKYFYDYDGVLCRGKITHNINNMWWVVANDFKCFNKSTGDLFDFVSFEEAPARKPKDYKIKNHIKEAIEKEDYLRAHLIKSNN